MPEDRQREDESPDSAPPSPEEMMQGLLRALPDEADLPLPEDFDAAANEIEAEPPVRPEDSPPQASLTPQLPEAVARLLAMQNQAATLGELLSKEEISFDDYQRLLHEAMTQDDDGIWWMIDAENNDWYRHDAQKNEWQVSYPSALRDYEAAQRQPESGYDLPDSLRGPAAGDPILDERGVQIGAVPPTKDELYTVPGKAALADELSAQLPAQPADAPLALAAPAPQPNAAQFDFQASPVARELRQSQGAARARLLLLLLAVLLIAALALGIVFAGGAMLWYRDRVEPFAEAIVALENYVPAYQTARIFDADGGLIAALDSPESGARTPVPLERVSPYMIHAIVSQENERYFDDPGFDPIAIARAFLQNLRGGGIESGASTITQQIARNLILQDRDVTLERKLNEILVAMEIANRYDKNFILELYLNEIFFANRSYGVEAAANTYFGHGADQLNYAQSALLASIVPSPLRHDPINNRETAIANMRLTMGKMLDIGCLQFQHDDWPTRGPFCIRDGAEVDLGGAAGVLVRRDTAGAIIGGAAILQIAEIETAVFSANQTRSRYPHFVEFVRAQLIAELGESALYQRGLSIYTTLDSSLQATAQTLLSQQVRELRNEATGINTGAVMVTDPESGAIRVMIGSHDFYDPVAGQVNNALSWQQPGSAIKPFVYAAALQDSEGEYLTPASIIWDVPLVVDLGAGGIYAPQNVDRRFHGAVSLRAALQNSYNVPTVKLFRDHVGIGRYANLAEAFGIEFIPDTLLTLAASLGANEVRLADMMSAYSVFANGGQRADLYAIERITESKDGDIVEIPRERSAPQPVISPALAYLMQNILSDDAARQPSFQPNSPLNLASLGIPSQNIVAAKTGTTNDSRDLWTMGFTRGAVVGVWLGTHDNAPTYNTSGIRSAAPVWNAVMAATSDRYPPRPFENPGGVVAREICRTTGTLRSANCSQPSADLFLQDQLPPPAEQGFLQRYTVDSWSLLLANEFCPNHATQMNFAVIDEPEALEWLNGDDAGRAYAASLDIALPLRPPPQAACTQGMQLPLVNLSSPNPGAVVRGAVEVRGQVQAPDFDKFELLYATAAEPDIFYPIMASLVLMPQYGTALGSWDTVAAQVPDGDVVLRLVATSLSGGSIQVDLPLTVDNSSLAPGDDAPGFVPTIESIIIPTPSP
ncbi:MAG: transglycosylase domain-containing protein [Chloroflexi bacterium]|nr:transglycosylase domain-containing protein [Chloroflexota bacterium]MCY4248671.1 transglycosylase domain-containing protein [Chloroflexota bacterium]